MTNKINWSYINLLIETDFNFYISLSKKVNFLCEVTINQKNIYLEFIRQFISNIQN
jgi:hypothetical protein